MDLGIFARGKGSTAAGTRRGELAHPECPIEQTVRGRDDATKARLTRFAWQQATACEGAVYVRDDHGLHVLARCETTLFQATEPLATLFRERVVLRPPAVRYVPGNPVLEPYMLLLVSGPEPYLPLVQKDMVRRRGCIVRVAERGNTFTLEAEAPLAQLIGYTSWLRELTEQDIAQASAWLSRYLPIDDGGPQAACDRRDEPEVAAR